MTARCAIVLAEGDALYGTEVAALLLTTKLREHVFLFHSMRRKLHIDIAGRSGDGFFKKLRNVWNIFFASKCDVVISCNHHFSVLACVLRLVTRRPVICWEHSEFGYAADYLHKLKRSTYRFASAVVVVNKSDLDFWSQINPNTYLIHNFVPICSVASAEGERISSVACKDVDVVYVGRDSPERGIDLLEEILVRLDDISTTSLSICLAGGTFEGIARRKFKKLDVCIIPYTENAISVVASGTVYINPARTEAFGISMFQASRLGKPVIAWEHTAGSRELATYEGFKGIHPFACEEFALAVFDQTKKANQFASKYSEKEIVDAWEEVLSECQK